MLAVALIGAGSASAAAPRAAAQVPCTAGSGGHHTCYFYPAGDGISAGAPVENSAGARVGYLNHGDNWVICELWAGRVGTSTVFNHYWAWTEANDGNWGWVNAYYARGGGNDGGFEGVPACGRSTGYPPGGAPPPASPAQVPCSAIGGGKFDCEFYPPGNGITGGAPVHSSSGATIGYLNQGTNWVLCQSVGAQVGTSTVYNDNWAYTLADDNQYGWVNAYYAKGGANNGSFAGVPSCGTIHGAPPGGAAQPTGGGTPKPATCRKTGSSQFTCTFYPAGNGITSGAPVEAADQSAVGYLNEGKNWITCQQVGGEVTVGSDHNHWWGRTEANDGRWGWVNAVYTSDGDNDGAFSGVPNCNGADGAVPQGPPTPPTGSPPPGRGAPPTGGGAPDEIPPVYVPIYQTAAAHYGVNWLLVASIHDQETNFSKSNAPGVRSGLNFAHCCAGPTQFSIIAKADTWSEYEHAFEPIAGSRPSSYPLHSGVTVCLPRGGHACVYDDFDAISATAYYLGRNGATGSLSSADTFRVVKGYGASSSYASQVIGRAEAWANGSNAHSRFGNVLYRSSAIKVTGVSTVRLTANATDAARRGHTGEGGHKAKQRARAAQPKLHVVVAYHGTRTAARKAFRAFIRAYHYASPGGVYSVSYRHVKAAKHAKRRSAGKAHHHRHKRAHAR